MADKKLNEVPVVSDIVTIFGKRSNGEIVQIDKSNLATLLGELLIASENNNGLMSAYYSQSITRMNGYSEGTSMSLAKLPIGFSYLNVVDSSDFPSKEV